MKNRWIVLPALASLAWSFSLCAEDAAPATPAESAPAAAEKPAAAPQPAAETPATAEQPATSEKTPPAEKHAKPAAKPKAPAKPGAPTINVWPETPPQSKGETEKDIPVLSIYLPAEGKGNGTAVMICPGGGYRGLAMQHEGAQVAEWLNSKGIAAFVLRYRLPANGYKSPLPLADAQRALRLIRQKAEEYHLDPARIGVMGFSAGGHLASAVGTLFDPGQCLLNDETDKISARPDFNILVYPCVSTFETFRYSGIGILAQNEKDPAEMRALSSEFNVTDKTPPTFLVHSDNDKGVNPLNSIAFYQALKQHKVPAELHIYEGGSHGWGMKNVGKPTGDMASRTWTDRLYEWFLQRGLVPAPVEKK